MGNRPPRNLHPPRSSRVVTDAEKDEAIALARRDYVAGQLTLEQFEAEVGHALAGDLDRCGYLSPFEPPAPRKPGDAARSAIPGTSCDELY